MTHRTKNMLLLLPLCAVLLLTGFTSSFEKSYQDAEALLAQGDYEDVQPGGSRGRKRRL